MFRALSSVRGRIIGGFVLLVLILIAVVAGSAWQVREHRSDTAAMEEHADTAFVIQNALVHAQTAATGVQRYVMVGDETLVAGEESLLSAIRSQMAALEESLAQALADAERRGDREQAARLYQISAEADSLIAGVEMLIALQESGDVKGAAAALEMSVLPFYEFQGKLEAAAETELQKVSTLRSRANRAGDLALWLLVISGATGAVLGLAASAFIARSIIKPLSALEATAIAVSRGDLEARTQATGPRELAHLGSALNQMTESLLDASKRRELEEALRQSEERYRLLADNVTDVIWTMDLSLRLTYISPSVTRLRGHSVEEAMAQKLDEVLTPPSLELARKSLAEELAIEDTEHKDLFRYRTLELEMIRKDGSTIWTEAIVSFLRDQDNGPVGLLGVSRDITERKRAEEALRKSEGSLADAQRIAHLGNWDWDIQANELRWSDETYRIFGLEPQEFGATYEAFLSSVHPDDREVVNKSVDEALYEGKPYSIDHRIVLRNGLERIVHEQAEVTRDDSGQPIRMVGTVHDITERKRAEEQLIRQRAVLDVINKVFRETLICETDADVARACIEAAEELTASKFGFIGEINQAGRFDTIALTDPGWAACRMPRSSATRLIKDMEIRGIWGKVLKDEKPLIVNDLASHPDRVGTPEGHPPLTAFLGVPLKRRNETIGMIGLANKESGYDAADQEDIEALSIAFVEALSRKRAEETIKHLAYHDALTDLPNRALFQDRLTVALAQARRKERIAAVLFLDLDHFKVVNDTVGHAEGDKLLRQVAERLGALVREGDTVARVGGDEFTLLFSDVAGVEDAAEIAERVLKAVRQPWALNGHEFHVTTSVGIAIYPNDGEDAESLLRNADTAMYRAKEQGRNNYQLYTPAMNARVVERLDLENSLRNGLERGEFVIYYQPQVNIRNEQIVGAEALVRWQHPERGLALPAEFLHVAEETGLIVPLGDWVLRAACAQNKAWQELGLPPLRVAVNLSWRQFQVRDLKDTVAQVLGESGLDPHYLQLEITEGVAMRDVEFAVGMLRELREMGVQIAIDDFGTGHSSLSYLRRLPIDVVKIDQSFVHDLTIDPDDAAIASAVIAMAHNLKLKVIAEGVETQEQLAFLKERQCDEYQGHLFAEPVPAEAFETILVRHKHRLRARAPVDSP